MLTVTVGYAGCLQVRTNYARNEAVESARELAEPVDHLCRDDPTARRQLGVVACQRAAEVVEPATRSPVLGELIGNDVLSLLVPRENH